MGLVNRLNLFKRCVSFGSVGSVAEVPAHLSHASVPESERSRLRFGPNLVRLSVGLEDPQDLIDDLRQALVHSDTGKGMETEMGAVESKFVVFVRQD